MSSKDSGSSGSRGRGGGKGTKLPVSALAEGMAASSSGKDSNGSSAGGRGSGRGGGAAGSANGGGGRGGAGGRGGGAGTSGPSSFTSRRFGGEGGDGQWQRRDGAPGGASGGGADGQQGGAPPASINITGSGTPGTVSAPATPTGAGDANYRGDGRGGSGGRGSGGRGGRGGRNSNPFASGLRAVGPNGVPVPGAMMTPFMPAAAPSPPNLVYYTPNAYNVFYPSTAFGFQAPAGAAAPSKQQIMESVKKQVDYYFSVENLSKDIFLRSKVRLCVCVLVPGLLRRKIFLAMRERLGIISRTGSLQEQLGMVLRAGSL